MERDYILTYWWTPVGPYVSTAGGPMGVAVQDGWDVFSAAAVLGRELAEADPNIAPDQYELISAVHLSDAGPVVEAVSLLVQDSDVKWNSHVSSDPQDGADRKLGSSGPNIYAVTGTETEDDLRFVQVLRARDLDQALLAVEDFLDKPGGEQVRFWSAVERFPNRHANVWWLGSLTRGMASFELVDQLAPSAGYDIVEALNAINRHRRTMGLRPLDPVAASWTDQDVLDEAKRIARLSNVAAHLFP